MNFCGPVKPKLDTTKKAIYSSGDALKLYEENWTLSLPGTPSPVAHSHRAFSDLSSTLSPETPLSDGSSIDFHISPIGLYVTDAPLRKVNKITQVATSRNPVPAFGASDTFSDILPGSSVTKPVLIPNKRGLGNHALPDHLIADLHNSGIGGAYIKAEEAVKAPFTDEQLGSWTERQIKYSVKTSAPAAEAPESAAPVYGFMPADVAAQAAVPSPTPAFWPEQGSGHSKGPHRAAMAEAARAAAVKPTQRVLFRAASRVEAPARPGAAKPLPPLVGRRRMPAQPPKPDTPELNVEEKIWRLQSKRAWIREQLRALRGFPKDSAYDEPWSDAFDMVQAMGDGLNLQTALPGDASDTDEDGFSSDSDLHEQLLFDEEPAKPQAPHKTVSKAGSTLGSATPGTLSTGTPSTASPPPANAAADAAKAGSTTPALSSAFKGPSLSANSNQPTTIVGCAQELMRHQRSIEIDADRAWQAKFAMHKPASPAAADKAPATAERRLMREDSAYEGLHKGGSRTSTKTAAPQGADKKSGAQQWVGEMLPAAEFDTDGVLTQAMIRVADERSGASCIILRGKKGQNAEQIVKAVKEQAALIAMMHGLDKPTVQLVRAGTMQWGDVQETSSQKIQGHEGVAYKTIVDYTALVRRLGYPCPI